MNIFISAGEPSGDLHGANLMKALKELNSDIKFFGIGGENMKKEGLNSLAELSEIAVSGFWEVAKKYIFFRSLEKSCQESIKKNNISVFVAIDYPGLNLRLANFTKKLGKKVFYYIAPQLWAWGIKRVKNLKENVDTLAVVLPFEEIFFSDYGINTHFVGHPLMDIDIFKNRNYQSFKKSNQIAFVPGSREQEVIRHLHLYKDIISYYNVNGLDCAVSYSSLVNKEIYHNILKGLNVIYYDDSKTMMKESYVGVVKTGTSNLEAALLEMPFVMIYKTSSISYIISKILIKMKFISLVNILRNREVIPELIQDEATKDKIINKLNSFISDKNYYNQILLEFRHLKSELNFEHTSRNAAKLILDMNNEQVN